MVESEKNMEQTIALAGLLHDIGKLLNRSSNLTKDIRSTQHPILSKVFIEGLEQRGIIGKSEILKILVQRHHEYTQMDEELLVQKIENDGIRKLAYIVSRADTYSSYERDDEKAKDSSYYKTRPLDSIFSRIKVNNKNKKSESTMQYKLKPFSPNEIFPKKLSDNKFQPGEVDEFIKKFGDDWNDKLKSKDFNELFTKLFFFLEKWLWCIPSDTTVESADISLFDHLKTTSALALASYQYHKEKDTLDIEARLKDDDEEKFLLFTGDISGIQKYIYGVESTDKMAKRLRARSFFISILTETVVQRYLKELNLTIANNVMSAGGKFYIIAPNTDSTKEKIEKLKSEIDKWMFEEFQAEIYLNTAYIELCGKDFKEKYPKKLDEINDKLDINKSKKYEMFLKNSNIIEKGYDGGEVCPICKKQWSKSKEEPCKKCKQDENVGGWLTRAKYIAFYNCEVDTKEKIEFFKNENKMTLCFFENEKDIEKNSFLVLNLKESEILKDFPSGFKYYAGYIPRYKDEKEYMNDKGHEENYFYGMPKTFENIAAKSTGVKNLALLKADVDNLGAIFSIGFKTDEKDNVSISRVATLSRMLDAFFSGWIPMQFERSENVKEFDMSNNYIVYSGGDDLMILGPWDKLILTSKHIYEKFREFTGENPDITFSAGVVLTKSSEPISHSSIKATDEEERAKGNGKDSLSLFGRAIKWKEFDKMIENGEFIHENMKGKDNALFSQSFVYRLLNYTTMAEEYAEDNRKVEKLMYYAKFMYDLRRNIIPKVAGKYGIKNIDENIDEIMKKEEIRKLNEDIFMDGSPEDKDDISKHFRLSLNWAVRKNRV